MGEDLHMDNKINLKVRLSNSSLD